MIPTAQEQQALTDGPVPTITCNGGEVTVLSAGLGRETENCGAEFKGFKNAEAEETRYIAVVTSEAAPGLSSNVDIKVVLPLNCPTFDELCGNYPDGSVSILCFDITDETRQQMAQMRTMVIGTDEEGNDITCDYNNLPALNALEESVGTTSAMPVAITKTGENTGLLTVIGADNAALPITYNPDNGIISMNLTEDDITLSGRLQAAYAEKQTVVTLVGRITVRLGEGLTVEVDASASRPLK